MKNKIEKHKSEKSIVKKYQSRIFPEKSIVNKIERVLYSRSALEKMIVNKIDFVDSITGEVISISAKKIIDAILKIGKPLPKNFLKI